MNKIGIDNFRSLKQTGLIELKPLTVLLGTNSTGKSTFLRILPLLKQSFNKQARGALTLYGDLVDFGDYKTVKTKNSNDDFLGLHFDFDIRNNTFYEYSFLEMARKIEDKQVNVLLDLKIKQKNDDDILFTSEIDLKLLNETVKLILSEEGVVNKIVINNIDFTDKVKNVVVNYNDSFAFPSFYSKSNNFASDFIIPFKEVTMDFFKKEKTKDNIELYIYRMLDFMPIRGAELERTDLFNNVLFSRSADYKKIEPQKWEKISLYCFFAQLPKLLNLIASFLSNEFAEVYYSKPLRVSAERYYRIQALKVNEVAPDGSNLMSFIKNISGKAKLDFDNWTKGNFGFSIIIKQYEGHQSIFIEQHNGDSNNVADMGFGFSEIIPIITQLWSIIYKSKNYVMRRTTNNMTGNIKNNIINHTIFAIEQPELHLHPGLQKKLISTFLQAISVAKEHDIDLKIIIETHSESMINYIGEEIENKKINRSDTSILIFNKNKENKSFITQSFYNNEGILNNWPIGFFD